MIKRFFITLILGMTFIICLAIYICGFGSFIKNPSNSEVKFNNLDNAYIKVYITKTKQIKSIQLEEYVKGVVWAEMPAEYNLEALKAQAVAARTFALAHMEAYGGKKYSKAMGADVTDSTACQVYMDKNTRFSKWPQKNVDEYYNKITEAVKSTKGQVLTYNNKLVMEPYYFSVSSGKTEDAKEVFGDDEPYLKSVQSFGEEQSPKYKSKITLSYSKFLNIIKSKYSHCNINIFDIKSKVRIIGRSSGGSVQKIKLGDTTILGTQFRSLLNLNSANFSLKFNTLNIEIECIGYGHDVGMSQWGANIMANKGANYKEILAHYYKGVNIEA